LELNHFANLHLNYLIVFMKLRYTSKNCSPHVKNILLFVLLEIWGHDLFGPPGYAYVRNLTSNDGYPSSATTKPSIDSPCLCDFELVKTKHKMLFGVFFFL